MDLPPFHVSLQVYLLRIPDAPGILVACFVEFKAAISKRPAKKLKHHASCIMCQWYLLLHRPSGAHLLGEVPHNPMFPETRPSLACDISESEAKPGPANNMWHVTPLDSQ